MGEKGLWWARLHHPFKGAEKIKSIGTGCSKILYFSQSTATYPLPTNIFIYIKKQLFKNFFIEINEKIIALLTDVNYTNNMNGSQTMGLQL